MSSAVTELVRTLRDTSSGQILVVTGAGVSVASGIPTFRGTDPDAIWKKDVTELGTHQFFREDPAGSWHFYLTRFAKVEGARPNDAHHALAALERWQTARGGDFLLVTQNIDTLHEQAGSSRLIKVHGTSDRYRCDRETCPLGAPFGSIPAAEVDLSAFRKEPVAANVPRCPRCGRHLRMHVLWFDEYYTAHEDYRFDDVRRAATRADVVVFVGTSFAVGVTDLVLGNARGRGVPIFNIDPTPRVDDRRVRSVALPAEAALVEVARELGAELHKSGEVG
jgi:NAD-dependent deacetylase